MTILFVMFATMKIADIGVVGDWSWWWVSCPIWLPVTLYLMALLIWIGMIRMRYFLRKKRYEKAQPKITIEMDAKKRFQMKLEEAIRKRERLLKNGQEKKK